MLVAIFHKYAKVQSDVLDPDYALKKHELILCHIMVFCIRHT